jgi:hypothetical protein
MAHKTFISYKYSEARDLRDRIIGALRSDAAYYRGETSESPDITDTSTENIKRVLTNQIFGTSVTIVVVSPNMTLSNWINWEIEYSLKAISRGDTTSHSNGIVGVIMRVNGGYGWIRSANVNRDGCNSIWYNSHMLYTIINNNRFNQEPKKYCCENCGTVDALTGSYISLVTEDDFLSNPVKYIENAYDKSRNVNNYRLCKQR